MPGGGNYELKDRGLKNITWARSESSYEIWKR